MYTDVAADSRDMLVCVDAALVLLVSATYVQMKSQLRGTLF